MEDYTVYTETYSIKSNNTHIKAFEQVNKVMIRHRNVKCDKHPRKNAITLKGTTKQINSFVYELSVRGVDGVINLDS